MLEVIGRRLSHTKVEDQRQVATVIKGSVMGREGIKPDVQRTNGSQFGRPR